MKCYVLGFMFNLERTKVCLIQKTKPTWQAGRLNGLGGKIEDYDETPAHAMVGNLKKKLVLKQKLMIGKNSQYLQIKN